MRNACPLRRRRIKNGYVGKQPTGASHCIPIGHSLLDIGYGVPRKPKIESVTFRRLSATITAFDRSNNAPIFCIASRCIVGILPSFFQVLRSLFIEVLRLVANLLV